MADMESRSPNARELPSRREEIVEAARGIAAVQGWPAVTVRAIGARIGCSAPAIYQYFRDKDAVLAALADDSFQRLEQALQDVWDGQDGGPAKRLRAVVRGFWQFGVDHPERYAVLSGLDGLPSRKGQGLPEALRRAASDLLAKRDGDETPEDLAWRLVATAHGFLSLTLSEARPWTAEKGWELLERVLDGVIRDIGR